MQERIAMINHSSTWKWFLFKPVLLILCNCKLANSLKLLAACCKVFWQITSVTLNEHLITVSYWLCNVASKIPVLPVSSDVMHDHGMWKTKDVFSQSWNPKAEYNKVFPLHRYCWQIQLQGENFSISLLENVWNIFSTSSCSHLNYLDELPVL